MAAPIIKITPLYNIIRPDFAKYKCDPGNIVGVSFHDKVTGYMNLCCMKIQQWFRQRRVVAFVGHIVCGRLRLQQKVITSHRQFHVIYSILI